MKIPALNLYTIRQFLPEEVELYKAIRLEALQQVPEVFGSSYAREAAFTPEEWRARLTNPNSACFGLFSGPELVGLTGMIIYTEKPYEAHLNQSYIQEAHRGKGLSRLLYEARLNWARERGLKYLVVAHRESNLASKAANQHFGFTYTHRESRTWPDGQTEDMLYYQLEV